MRNNKFTTRYNEATNPTRVRYARVMEDKYQYSASTVSISQAVIAQQVEQLICNEKVQGSTPCDGTTAQILASKYQRLSVRTVVHRMQHATP